MASQTLADKAMASYVAQGGATNRSLADLAYASGSGAGAGLARKGKATTPQAITATANINTYASLPTPLVVAYVLPAAWTCLFILTAFVDTTTNNVEVACSLDFSGATVLAAGTNSEDRLHVNGKSPVGITLSREDYASVNQGTTNIELKYAATGAATLSDVALAIIPIWAN
jgi:hypothetical protein